MTTANPKPVSATRALVEATKQRLAQNGYIPAAETPRMDWTPQLPNPEVLERTETGLPADWNYRTAQLSPTGQKLPRGAIGWTSTGDAFYGGTTGLGNWARKLLSSFNAPVDTTARQSGQERLRQAQQQAADADVTGIFFLDIPKIPTLLSSTIEGAQGLAQIFQNLGGGDEGEKPTALTYAGRGVSNIIEGGLNVAIEGGEQLGQVRGALANAADAAGIGETPATEGLRQTQEILTETAAREKTGDLLTDATTWAAGRLENWFVPLLYSIEPSGIMRDVLGGLVAPLFGVKGETYKEGYFAGRILYSTFQDPALKQEYLRRWRAGENAYLLAEELQNPMAEMMGEMLADPLNIVGLFTKPMLAAGRLDDATKLLATVIDDAAPGLKALSEATTDIERGSRLMDLAQDFATINSKRAFGIAEKAEHIAFTAGTMEARANYLSSLTGEFARSIAAEIKLSGSANYVDDTLDIFKGFIMRASDDPQEVANGIAFLTRSRLPGEVLFSPASADMGIILRRMLANEDGVVDIANYTRKLSKAPEEMMATVSKQIDAATADMFPAISKRIQAVDAVASGDAARIAKADPRLVAWAKEGGTVGIRGRAIAKAESLASSPGLRVVNGFFASVYMGMSPGYYARNVITNTFHGFVDGGIEVFAAEGRRLTPSLANAGTQRLLGRSDDILASAKGIGAGLSAPGLSADAPQGLNRIFQTFLTKGNEAERNMSSLLAYRSVRDTMDKAFTAMRRSTESGLVTAGVDADLLYRLVRDNDYNIERAGQLYRRAMDAGYIDPLHSLEFMTDELAKGLDSYDLLAHQRTALQKALDDTALLSREERLAALKEANQSVFRKYVDDFIENMPEEAGRVPKDLLDDGLAAMGESGYVSDTINDLSAKQQGWNKLVRDTISGEGGLIQSAEHIAQRLGVDPNAIKAANPQWQRVSTMVAEAEQSWGRWQEGALAVYREMRDTTGGADWARYWRELNIPGNPPANLTKSQLINYWWEGYYYPRWRNNWIQVREQHFATSVEYLAELRKAVESAGQDASRVVDANQLRKLEAQLTAARKWDTAQVLDGGVSVLIGTERADNLLAVRKLGILNGVATASSEGRNLDKVLLSTINKYLPEGTPRFANLYEVPFEVAEAALQQRATTRSLTFQNILGARPGSIAEAAPTESLKRLTPYLNDGATPSDVQMMLESRQGLSEIFAQIERQMDQAFNAPARLVHKNPQVEAALAAWEKQGGDMMTTARVVAPRVALEFRNFALIDYGDRRNFDTVLGLLYPYQFWHSRTYKNWLTRIMYNPALAAHYARYKDTMAEIHAGLPDWWKYNVNSNELFGLDWNNPLYFNLEATLNPVNGLTGIDFEDRYRRANWFASTLDDLNKFGPSTWTPLSILTALSLQSQGDEEAASRWAGRLIPQTATAASIKSFLERGVHLGPFEWQGLGKGSLDFADVLTKDPMVELFSDGIDPYTRRRVGRALAAMVEEGLDPDVATDAAYSQTGEIWEEAMSRAINERAPGQIFSSFFGVGFKARSPNDLMIDQFDAEHHRLWAMRDTLTQQEFSNQMDALKQRYPFMDTLMLSRKGGPERDASLAWMVLGKLPPGSTRLLTGSGLDDRLLNQFYDTKADWSQWRQTDKDRFMAAIIDLQAIVKTPDNATRAEWSQVRNLYRQMMDNIPEATRDAMFHFWSLEDQEERDAFLAANPQVEPAMQFRSRTIASTPLLASYYGGLSAIENYYKGEMYRRIEEQLGADVWDRMDTDRNLRARYARLRDSYLKQIDQAILRVGRQLPEPRRVQTRQVEEPTTFQQDFIASTAPVRINWPQALADLGDTALRAIRSALAAGEPLSSTARSRLQQAADNQGVSLYYLLFQLRAQYGY